MGVKNLTSVAAWLVALAPSVAMAQGEWTTFFNDQSQRQGAFYCAEMNTETGQFFCVELACDPQSPLTLEFSHEAGRWEDVLMAEFRVNGRSMGVYDFSRVAGSGYANYASTAAAADVELQAMLRNGATAEIAIGTLVVPLSLNGSARAIRAASEACAAQP